MTKIIDYDASTGITETFIKDAGTGQIRVNRSQDTSIVTKITARERNAASSGWKEDFHKVATIPLIVVEQWQQELKAKGFDNPNPLAVENQAWLMRRLNDREHMKLRTKMGSI